MPAFQGNPIPAPTLAINTGEETTDVEPNNELAEAQPLSLHQVANGHIGDGGDWDVYRFEGVVGTPMVLEVQAERLGVPLDSVMEILDESGEVLQRAVARCTAETHITLFSRDSRGAGLRLDDWSALSMNDYVMASGEIVKVKKIPDYSDEDVVFGSVGGQRLSLFGTSPQHHAVYSSVYRVGIHPPGTTFPPNGMPVFPVFWRNDDGFFEGKLSSDSRLVFEAPEAKTYYVRVRDAAAGTTDRPYRLALRELAPDFQISAGTYRVNVHEGAAYPVVVNITRRDEFDAPVSVWIDGLPDGVHASRSEILPENERVVLRVWADAGAESSVYGATPVIRAKAVTPSGSLERETAMGVITAIQQQADLAVHASDEILEIPQGDSGPLAVSAGPI